MPPLYSAMNGFQDGSEKPEIDELLILSEIFNVSVNQLFTGDRLFPCLHELEDEDAKRLLAEIVI